MRQSAESIEANLATGPNKQRDRNAIIMFLDAHELGATCDEMEQFLGMSHQTCSARCSDLKNDRIIVRKPHPSGRGYLRAPTRTGSPAAVLILAKYLPRTPFDENGQASLF